MQKNEAYVKTSMAAVDNSCKNPNMFNEEDKYKLQKYPSLKNQEKWAIGKTNCDWIFKLIVWMAMTDLVIKAVRNWSVVRHNHGSYGLNVWDGAIAGILFDWWKYIFAVLKNYLINKIIVV